ncbi:MAG: hypothetical protein A2139_03635 [Desulfobacca sp. RBG_16_60_12]|nr:MAG: hypothetical protein A2139_03635 [Desulfobacca sp. RBG_16_60_12]
MPGPGGVRSQVETYSGSRLHERPWRFTRGGAWLEVRQILERWQDPDHLHFKVVAEDGGVYLLSYHYPGDAWEARPVGGLAASTGR